MPYTNVDASGKNVVSGVMLDVSEKTATIVEGLRAFQLAQPSATLMTDGGTAYPEAVMKQAHIYFKLRAPFQSRAHGELL